MNMDQITGPIIIHIAEIQNKSLYQAKYIRWACINNPYLQTYLKMFMLVDRVSTLLLNNTI